MTSYTVDVPDLLWDEYKETFPRRMTVNQGLVEDIAEITLAQRGEALDAHLRARIEKIRREQDQ